MHAKHVLADKVEIPSEQFGNSQITLSNLSDAPRALGEPIVLELKSNETPAALNLTVDYNQPGSPQISGTFEGFDLGKMQSNLGEEAGLAFDSGAAAGTFTGQLTKERIDLTIKLDETGSMVWKLCDGDHAVEEIAAALEKGGVAEARDVGSRLATFLDQMSRRGMIGWS